MEGRAIARPNHSHVRRPVLLSVKGSFNGGPGNCPAKRYRGRYCPKVVEITELQWRAGQLPGQTAAVHGWPVRLVSSIASMEGRAIARPNKWVHEGVGSVRRRISGFNGGPGNCPAKPLVKIGAFDLPVCGRLRAVVEASASRVPGFCCQAAFCLQLQGIERSPGLACSP